LQYIQSNYQALARKAAEQQWSHLDYLAQLVEREFTTREMRSIERRISCQCPAIRDRSRCRLHGGLSPGAPRGDQNGNYVDGHYTAEAVRERRWAKSLLDTFGKDKPHG